MTSNKVTELWYDNPSVLFQDMNQFLPLNSLSPNEKINSLIRLAIYYSIIILFLNTSYNKRVLFSISIIIILSSFIINPVETFNQVIPNMILPDVENCQKSTENNPFMNYTLGDLIENPNREKACNYVTNKESIKQNFNKLIDVPLAEPKSIWPNNLSDRNFYTMPNTGIVSEQEEFAKWCFGDSGKCKTKGQDCLKVVDPIYHIGRITKI